MTYQNYFYWVQFHGSTDSAEKLPAEVEAHKNNLKQIGALDLSDPETRLEIGSPFWEIAVNCNINLFPEDLKYIKNVINKDPVFDLICRGNILKLDKASILGLDGAQQCEAARKKIMCYERFYNDKKIPKGLRLVLYTILGSERAGLPANLSEVRRLFLVERWLDKCRAA